MINDNTTRFKYIWFVLFYITFIFVAIIYSYQVFTNANIKQVTWQDVASYDFELVDQTYEDGTLTNTYGISTPEQLAGVFSIDEYTQQNIDKANAAYADDITSIGSPNDVKQINNEYVLLNDVNMSGRSWTPTANFTGTFNGNYHVIQNLSISSSSYAYLGMVQRLSGTIKNLFLKNINVSNNRNASGQGGAGSVAGECYGYIENVTVLSGSITGPQYYNNDDRKTGGITGALASGQVINCVNYASVTRSKFSGGIVGVQYSGTTIQFCYNYGTISNGKNDHPRSGGICGESYGTIKLCVNYGNVTSTTTPNGSGDVRAGGIVGYTTQSIDQCANFGTVTAGTSSTDTTYVGGIAGYTDQSITNCCNLADVTGNAKITTTDSSTYNCTTYSDIRVHQHQHFYWSWLTDEFFYTRSKPTITENTKKAYSGGIAGKASSAKYCYSVGTVEGGYVYNNASVSQSVKGIMYVNGFMSKGCPQTYTFNDGPQWIESLYIQPIVPNCSSVQNCYYSSSITTQDINSLLLTGGVGLYLKISIDWGYSILTMFTRGSGQESSLSCDMDYLMNKAGQTEYDSNPGLLVKYYESNNYFYIKSTITNYYNDEKTNAENVNSHSTVFSTSIPQITVYGTSRTADSIKTISLNSNYWSKNDNIFDGYPYLKNLYW